MPGLSGDEELVPIDDKHHMTMTEILEKLSTCVEFGKIDIKSPYPPSMKDQEGAFELTQNALLQVSARGRYLKRLLYPRCQG